MIREGNRDRGEAAYVVELDYGNEDEATGCDTIDEALIVAFEKLAEAVETMRRKCFIVHGLLEHRDDDPRHTVEFAQMESKQLFEAINSLGSELFDTALFVQRELSERRERPAIRFSRLIAEIQKENPEAARKMVEAVETLWPLQEGGAA